MNKILCFFMSLFLGFTSVVHADKDVDALKQKVSTVLPKLDGWGSKEKALNFIDLVLEVKPKVCVEIGVFGGRSLFPVASALKFLGNGIVIGIDPWDRIECIKYFDPVNDKAHLEWWGRVNLNQVYYGYINTIIRHGLEPFCHTIKKTAQKAASEIPAIDILHLDGNHHEIASVEDVTLYLPKVRSGGYIWINDAPSKEIQPAVAILAQSCDLVKTIDNGSCILFRKR